MMHEQAMSYAISRLIAPVSIHTTVCPSVSDMT